MMEGFFRAYTPFQTAQSKNENVYVLKNCKSIRGPRQEQEEENKGEGQQQVVRIGTTVIIDANLVASVHSKRIGSRERIIHRSLNLMGHTVIVTLTNGSMMEGFFRAYTPFQTAQSKNENVYVLKNCKSIRGPRQEQEEENKGEGQQQVVRIGTTVIIGANMVASVHSKRIGLNTKTNGNSAPPSVDWSQNSGKSSMFGNHETNAFRTCGGISGKRGGLANSSARGGARVGTSQVARAEDAARHAIIGSTGANISNANKEKSNQTIAAVAVARIKAEEIKRSKHSSDEQGQQGGEKSVTIPKSRIIPGSLEVADSAQTIRNFSITNSDAPYVTAKKRNEEVKKLCRQFSTRTSKAAALASTMETVRLLMKNLKQKDKSMYAHAQATIKECIYRNRKCDLDSSSLALIMQIRLRETVGPVYWKRAKDYVTRKRKRVETATRETPKQQKVRVLGAPVVKHVAYSSEETRFSYPSVLTQQRQPTTVLSSQPTEPSIFTPLPSGTSQVSRTGATARYATRESVIINISNANKEKSNQATAVTVDRKEAAEIRQSKRDHDEQTQQGGKELAAVPKSRIIPGSLEVADIAHSIGKVPITNPTVSYATTRKRKREVEEQDRQISTKHAKKAEKLTTETEQQLIKSEDCEVECLSNIDVAELSKKNVDWFCRVNGEWKLYPSKVRKILECNYVQGAKVKFALGNKEYEIDFSAPLLKQVNIETQSCRKVRRQEGNNINHTPCSWSEHHIGKNFNYDTLSPYSVEWKHVENLMSKTMQSFQIKEIKQIQNISVWNFFLFQKEEMARRSRGVQPKSAHVWHGTKLTDPTKICEDANNGFNVQYSRMGQWGTGIYFAEDAKYSDSYAFRNSDGSKVMILAELLTGDEIDLNPDMSLKEPPKKAGREIRYDTVTGKRKGSKVYIVYDNGRAYPKYLVTYKTL